MFETRLQQRQRRGPSNTVDLAPLMDMVFILLVFFLVTSTFSRDTGIEVDSPRAVTASPVPSTSLRFVIASSGKIFLDGESIKLEDIPSQIERTRYAHRGNVVIVSDATTPSGQLIAVIDAAKLGGADVIAVGAESTTRGAP